MAVTLWLAPTARINTPTIVAVFPGAAVKERHPAIQAARSRAKTLPALARVVGAVVPSEQSREVRVSDATREHQRGDRPGSDARICSGVE